MATSLPENTMVQTERQTLQTPASQESQPKDQAIRHMDSSRQEAQTTVPPTQQLPQQVQRQILRIKPFSIKQQQVSNSLATLILFSFSKNCF